VLTLSRLSTALEVHSVARGGRGVFRGRWMNINHHKCDSYILQTYTPWYLLHVMTCFAAKSENLNTHFLLLRKVFLRTNSLDLIVHNRILVIKVNMITRELWIAFNIGDTVKHKVSEILDSYKKRNADLRIVWITWKTLK